MQWIKKLYGKLSPTKRNTRYLEEVINDHAKRSGDTQQELFAALNNLQRHIEGVVIDADRTRNEQLSEIEERLALLDVVSETTNKISVDTSRIDRLVSKRPVSVLFIVHNIEVWTSLSGIYALMAKDDRFDVYVASCPRRYPNSDIYQNEEVVDKKLTELGIPHLRLTSKNSFDDLNIIKRLRPDVIFRQSKWDIDIPPAFSTQYLRFARLYSVSYGVLPMLDHSFENGFNYYENSLETLFVVNDEVRSLYDKNITTGVSIVTTGHPRVDEIIGAKAKWPIETNNRYRVIWSAHHSIFKGWNDFGTFLTTYPLMLRLAKKHTDVDFLFSPHPGLLGAFERLKKEDEQAHQAVDEFLTTWEKLPNTDTIHNGGYIEPMKASNLLVVDGVSLLMEYQLIQQPIVCLEREGHGAFNEIGEKIMQGVNRVPSEDGDAVCKKIEYFINGGEDDTRKFQKENVKFLTQYTHAAKKIVDHIAKDFGK